MSILNDNGTYAVENIKKRQLEKLADTVQRMGNRTGPNIVWLNEVEDDTKLRLPYSDFRDGIPTFSTALNDFEKGIAILGGLPNHSKSSILTNLQSWGLRQNDDLMVLDFTLDDDFDKRFQQHVACMSGLTYQQITTKSDLTTNQINNRDKAVGQLATWFEEDRIRFYEPLEKVYNHQGKLVEVVYRKLSNILSAITAARISYPKKKIVATIDAWNNVQVETPSGNTSELSTINEQFHKFKSRVESLDVMVIASAHLRKGAGDGDPNLEDIKGSSNIGYDNVWAGIVWNGFKAGEENPLMWEDDNGRELPIITIGIPKSKVSAFTFPLIYAIDDMRCRLIPLSRADYSHYYTLIKKKKRDKK
jgi:hypothetical protein